jgi:t-SNARE complex subunit (syntaxin)
MRRSTAEVARRQCIFDNLKKQMSLLVVSGSPLTGAASSSSGNNVDRASQSSTGSGFLSELSMNPIQTQTSAGLLQRQQEVIKLQDDMLADISKGVDVLHGQAVRIGEEVTIQNKILDKLDTQVDAATDELRAEAAHAEKINKSTAMCSYYICVVVEVIVIIVLLIFVFGIMK